jgi:demethoxyubiquinone hydroxylase (CLK1/Coq7/Cat5 family)
MVDTSEKQIEKHTEKHIEKTPQDRNIISIVIPIIIKLSPNSFLEIHLELIIELPCENF